MTSWLIPANTKFYDVFAAMAQTKTYWPVNAKISAGDKIYLYLAAPYKQIAFVCEVLEVGIEMEAILEEVRPFLKSSPDSGTDTKPFMKIKPLKNIPIESGSALSLQYLKEHGLNGMLMGARKLENNKELFDHIRNNTGA